MKIAILGTRGVPARYGGFETLADQLATRLVRRGHHATVYCRKPFVGPNDDFDRRIRRVILPTISSMHLDTLFNTFLSVLHVLFTDSEALLICNVANSPVAWIPRLVGKPTALNVDGLDRKRRKWNFLGRWFLHLCEALAVFTPTRLVTDAGTIRNYFWNRYHKTSEMIAYGADPVTTDGDFFDFGLSSRQYILYVARLEPENNPEFVIRAYRDVDTDWPLVIVGGNPYRPAYVKQLESIADKRVVFTGPVYGDGYWRLQNNAGLVVFAGEIGGIHPVLVEAMAARNAILYLDTPTNHETTGGCGISFRLEQHELATKMTQLIGSPQQIQQLRQRAQRFAQENYSWERIVDQYERLFEDMLRQSS